MYVNTEDSEIVNLGQVETARTRPVSHSVPAPRNTGVSTAAELRPGVAAVQRWINARTFGPGSGRTPLVVDGLWGDTTEWGLTLTGGVAAIVAAVGGLSPQRLDARMAMHAMTARDQYLRGR